MVTAHLKELDALAKQGVGIVCLHYAVEAPKGPKGSYRIARAGNSSPTWRTSVYVDPNGRILHQTEVTDPDTAEDGPLPATGFVAEVPLMDLEYRTPYTRTGELFNGLVVLLLAGLAIRGRRRFQ